MKTVILAGGMGSRLAEETELRPKPMIEIGGRPILWHIMKGYSEAGFNEFCVALGYKGDAIKRYFLEYHGNSSSVRIDLSTGRTEFQHAETENWKVDLVDTGLRTNTGGRIRRLAPWLGNDAFFLTYGDGLSDVNLHSLMAFHREQGKLATVTAVRPPARFGGLVFNGPLVSEFTEKPQTGEGWINGGFMVFEPAAIDYLKSDDASLETDLLEPLALNGQLAAYRHEGFWQCVDTLRDLRLVEGLWNSRQAPWKQWD